jgi:hypothetical protein
MSDSEMRIFFEISKNGRDYAMATYEVTAPNGAKRGGMDVLVRRADADAEDALPWEHEPDPGIRADVWEEVRRHFKF